MHGVLPCPNSSYALEVFMVLFVESSYVWLHADLAVGVGEQRLDADEDLGDGECQAPVVMDGVQANVTMLADVGVKYTRDETDNWRPHGITGNNINITSDERTTGSLIW